MNNVFGRMGRMAFLLLAYGHPAHAQPPPLQGFEGYIQKAMREWESPGLAVSIVKDDKVVYAKGFGVRKLGEPAAIDERTIFAIGSSSKAFTAAAIAMLVDEGKLQWDDPATKHLPGFQLYDPAATRELTVRDLLCHRVGLERGDALWYGTSHSRDEILHRVRYLKPGWGFRAKYGYQNLMFLAAGQIVPAVTGKGWDDFIKERVFIPLGMKSSLTSTKPLEQADNVANPHTRKDGKPQPVPWRNLDNIAPAGSINSNVIDMAQWVRLQLNLGKMDGKQLIRESSAREMHTPQMVMRIGKWPDEPSPVNVPGTHFAAYGLGWFLQDYRGRKVVQHGGAIDGMRAMVAMVPEEKLGFVLLSNYTSSMNEGLMFRIIDHYLGGPDRDWSAEILAGFKKHEDKERKTWEKKVAERVKETSPSLALEKYAGTYRNETYGDAKVTWNDQRLSLHLLGDVTQLGHWHYDTFLSESKEIVRPKSFATFALDAQGRVEELKLQPLGVFKRVP